MGQPEETLTRGPVLSRVRVQPVLAAESLWAAALQNRLPLAVGGEGCSSADCVAAVLEDAMRRKLDDPTRAYGPLEKVTPTNLLPSLLFLSGRTMADSCDEIRQAL